jgi:hypothetical protein
MSQSSKALVKVKTSVDIEGNVVEGGVTTLCVAVVGERKSPGGMRAVQ